MAVIRRVHSLCLVAVINGITFMLMVEKYLDKQSVMVLRMSLLEQLQS